MTTQKIETRVTDWQNIIDGPWYTSLSHGGYVAYRIFIQSDGMRWFQRHEWRCADGSIETEKWIPSIADWGQSKIVAKATRSNHDQILAA